MMCVYANAQKANDLNSFSFIGDFFDSESLRKESELQ